MQMVKNQGWFLDSEVQMNPVDSVVYSRYSEASLIRVSLLLWTLLIIYLLIRYLFTSNVQCIWRQNVFRFFTFKIWLFQVEHCQIKSRFKEHKNKEYLKERSEALF